MGFIELQLHINYINNKSVLNPFSCCADEYEDDVYEDIEKVNHVFNSKI